MAGVEDVVVEVARVEEAVVVVPAAPDDVDVDDAPVVDVEDDVAEPDFPPDEATVLVDVVEDDPPWGGGKV